MISAHTAAMPQAPAAESLFHELYDQLRRLARARLRRNEPITLLDTTGLVHESYLRLAQGLPGAFNDRDHFLATASRTMRFVVVDFIRAHRAQARGGDQVHVTLDTSIGERATLHDEQILQLHEALEELVQIDPRLAAGVEMRCFAGLSEQEIADAQGVNVRTVRRDWQKARTLLKAAMD
jgi:RNA polymerase sigma factor (TIGR02999 family)